jgi:hypothetical protein
MVFIDLKNFQPLVKKMINKIKKIIFYLKTQVLSKIV